MKELLADYTLDELKQLLAALGEKEFRALQLYQGINQGKDWSQLTTLSKDLKQRLGESYDCQGVTIRHKLVSKDGTTKYLFALRDGNIVEGVVMQYRYGNTLCLSTQVGCRMNCAFCASGLDGLVRNLSPGEMLGQVLCANVDFGGDTTRRAITNVVLMGSGEPLDNYDNVAKFLRLVSCAQGLNISLRNISLSTCGLVEGVDKLIADRLFVTLTFSLHAPSDAIRNQIMPVNHAYPLSEVIGAARRYFDACGRRVIFEYTLIDGLNDTPQCATMLAQLVRGFPTHVNLIVLNYVPERGLKGTPRVKAKAFCDALTALGVSATVRRTMGADIEGACGQLRRRYVD